MVTTSLVTLPGRQKGGRAVTQHLPAHMWAGRCRNRQPPGPPAGRSHPAGPRAAGSRPHCILPHLQHLHAPIRELLQAASTVIAPVCLHLRVSLCAWPGLQVLACTLHAGKTPVLPGAPVPISCCRSSCAQMTAAFLRVTSLKSTSNQRTPLSRLCACPPAAAASPQLLQTLLPMLHCNLGMCTWPDSGTAPESGRRWCQSRHPAIALALGALPAARSPSGTGAGAAAAPTRGRSNLWQGAQLTAALKHAGWGTWCHVIVQYGGRELDSPLLISGDLREGLRTKYLM